MTNKVPSSTVEASSSITAWTYSRSALPSGRSGVGRHKKTSEALATASTFDVVKPSVPRSIGPRQEIGESLFIDGDLP